MAFHYQNLIQEKDYTYPEFKDQYKDVLRYTAHKLKIYRKKHSKIYMRDLWNYARQACTKTYHLPGYDKVEFPKRQERILIVTNIIFPDNDDFLETLKAAYSVCKEDCENLKKSLNELDRQDGDFLDSTMEGIVRYHIPAFDSMKKDLKLGVGDEFIIWKLMEIMYLDPDTFEKVFPRQKSLS